MKKIIKVQLPSISNNKINTPSPKVKQCFNAKIVKNYLILKIIQNVNIIHKYPKLD